MKIKLNNKEIEAKFLDNKIEIYPDKDDLTYIINWKKSCIGAKQDFVKDILFESVTKKGILGNCQPILDFDNVYIIFDTLKF
jgi:hypothetical protein